VNAWKVELAHMPFAAVNGWAPMRPRSLASGVAVADTTLMSGSRDVFATGLEGRLQFKRLGGQVPVLLVDNIFEDPAAVRRLALSLPYEPAGAHYPGRTARVSESNESLTNLLRKVAALVTREYLPKLPPLPGGRRATVVRAVDTDFAITDLRPSELTKEQSRPHVDDVPVFGLIYLNEQDRGGTLFFRPRGHNDRPTPRTGYQVDSDEFVDLYGKIEGRFNRLAIYPGFILHSGEISGEWITTEERLREPRLTQRMMFLV
jgi:hypothetical protein